jgi:hypothetical protein
MNKRAHQLIVGLPGAGKTTFLAALWQVVEYDGINATLSVKRLDGDREHLNEIRGRWLRCEEQRRTSSSSETSVSMILRDRSSGTTTEISFPDMSGESFRAQWTTRQWSREYDTLVERTDGVMLFIHPSTIVEPQRIDQADALVAALGGDTGQSGPDAEATPWNADDSATQVQLVELLQFIADRRHALMRLVIVISAWDVARQAASTPVEWLQRRVPLLHQYVFSNDDLWNARAFGVSAQGGDFATESERLLSEHVPAERVIVFDGNTKSHDITLPVRALMDIPEADR